MEDVTTTGLLLNIPDDLHRRLWEMKHLLREHGRKVTIESLAIIAVSVIYSDPLKIMVRINGVDATGDVLAAAVSNELNRMPQKKSGMLHIL